MNTFANCILVFITLSFICSLSDIASLNANLFPSNSLFVFSIYK